MSFQTIITHEKPHLDEITAIWLLKRFGEVKFPGISKAEIIFWNTGGKAPDNQSAEDYEAKGVLLIGVGGGRFDEHPTATKNRKEGECAATLVAKALGINDNPALSIILKFVTDKDLKGSGTPFDLGGVVKTWLQQRPDEPIKAIGWVMVGLDVKYQEQLSFLTETKEEFEKNSYIFQTTGPKGDKIKVAVCRSDDQQINKFARSVYGGNASIVVQQQTTGNVQIFVDGRSGLKLYEVVKLIRLKEQMVKGEIITNNWKELALDGKVAGAEEWYFQESGQMLLNGSLTANGVPPTKLTLDEIIRLIVVGVNPKTFEPMYEKKCQEGICSSTKDNECPLYSAGLSRCTTIRYNSRQ